MSPETTRADHIDWCKQRAMAYLPSRPAEAVASMLSDLGKHPDTRGLVDTFGMIALFSAGDAHQASQFIQGFN